MSLEIQIDDDILVRPIEIEDVEMYYKYGFEESDDEANYYTGTTQSFTYTQIKEYVERIIGNSTRKDYLIIECNKIIGEVVLTEINQESCHFRICIFNKNNFSRGIGKKVTKWMLSYAFNNLGLKNVELEVFPFNERGLALYEKLGFLITDRIVDKDSEEPYRDIIVMNLKVTDYIF